MGESRLIVAAGRQDTRLPGLYSAYLRVIKVHSDTTSATFTTLPTLLGSNPQQLSKLQAKIDAVYDSYPNIIEEVILLEIIKGGTTATEHLEEAIKEALQMNPLVPDGVQRVVLDEGMSVNGTFIPGGVQAGYTIRAAHIGKSLSGVDEGLYLSFPL